MEQIRQEAEAEYVLELIPFGNVPQVPFETIRVGDAATRTVIVRNTTNKPVRVRRRLIPSRILQALPSD